MTSILKGQRRLILLFIAALVLFVGLSTIGHQKMASADASALPPAVQCDVAGYDAASGGCSSDECDSFSGYPYGLNPGYFPWISAYQDSSTQTFSVSSGSTSSVDFDFNNLVYVCHNAVVNNYKYPTDSAPVSPYTYNGNSGLQLPSSETFDVKAATATSSPSNTTTPTNSVGSVSVLGGNYPIVENLPGYGSSSSRYWQTPALGMSFNPTNAINGTVTVYINIEQTEVSYFNGLPYCVSGYYTYANGTYTEHDVPGEEATNGFGWGFPDYNCVSTWVNQPMTLTVVDNIQSNIFTVNPDGSGQTQVGGVQFTTCNANISGTSGQNSANGFYYLPAPDGSNFCLRINNTGYNSSSSAITGYDGPYVRPYDMGDPGGEDNYPSSTASGLQACSGGPFGASNLQDHCQFSTYECQTAGEYAVPDACGQNDYDRASDGGYDFDYVALCKDTTSTGNVQNCSGGQNPTAPTCSLTASAADPEQDKPFTVTATITNNGTNTMYFTNPPSDHYSSTFSADGLGLSFTGPSTINGGATWSTTMNDSGESTLGTYNPNLTVSWTLVNGTTQSIPCGTTVNIATLPYVRVFGGDVLSGVDSDYIQSCYDNPAGIESFNNNVTGANNIGAGTNLADLATGGIVGFVSGQDNSGYSTLDPFSFANTPTSTYGGGYGSLPQSCPGPDYYSEVYNLRNVPGSNVSACPSTIDGMNLTPGIGTGHQYICYATSTVTIADNVTYTGFTSTTNPADMPVFEVVVYGGGITIDTGVTNVAGTYIAEYNSTSTGGLPSVTGNGNICDTTSNSIGGAKLTVDGTFIANTMYLYRTNGSLSDNTSSVGIGDENDAEEFDYSPINWLAPTNPTQPSNSIISLPPVF